MITNNSLPQGRVILSQYIYLRNYGTSPMLEYRVPLFEELPVTLSNQLPSPGGRKGVYAIYRPTGRVSSEVIQYEYAGIEVL